MDQVSIVSQNSHFMSFTREFQHEFYAHPDISSFFLRRQRLRRLRSFSCLCYSYEYHKIDSFNVVRDCTE